MVVADDLGVDRVGVYAENPDPGRTPTIDRLARQKGVWFRNAWSNPTCSPTRAMLLTGRYSFRTGVGMITTRSSPNPGLDPAEVLLPEALGVQSFVAGKWHLATESMGSDHPQQAGFDHHAGSLFNIGNQNTYYDWPKTVDGVTSQETTYATTDTVDEALSALASFDPAQPWFLLISFNAPHKPLHAPPTGLHSYDLTGDPDDSPADHFKAMVEAMDSELGRLLQQVNLATTTLVFLGDNGTERLGVTAPQDPDKAKATMYEGGLNVPLIVAGRGVTGRGEVPDALVGVTDVFATVLELSGAASETPADSVSLVPYLADPFQPSIRPWAYAENFRPNGTGVSGPWQIRRRAIRDGRYKLIRVQGAADEFYDLQEDPFELLDLVELGLSSEQQAAKQALSAALVSISG